MKTFILLLISLASMSAIAGEPDKMTHQIIINRSAAEVFNYATDASRWREWHPATKASHASKEGSLQVGETVTEEIVVAHRETVATWTVRIHEAPSLWQIDTANEEGESTITYQVIPLGLSQARFIRKLEYRMTSDSWALNTFMKYYLRYQSAKALKNLKNVLENKFKQRGVL